MNSLSIMITGGSRGLGRALAMHLAALGHQVAVTGRDGNTLEVIRKELPDDCLVITADACDDSDSLSAVEQVISSFGRIDVLINNAGTSGPGGPTWETSVEDWWRVQETNVKGPMMYIHAVLPGMLERGSGYVINIGSYASIRPCPGNSTYAASKAALARLSDSLAEEVAAHGVQVFCVSPGLVETDMTRGKPAFKDIPPEEWSSPDQLCQTVTTLLERDCNSLSGRFLHVNDSLEGLLSQIGAIEEKALYRLGLSDLEGRIL